MYNLKLCWILYEEAVFEFRDGDAGGDRRSLTERISSPIISHNKAGKWKGSWMDADISRSGQRRVRSSLMNRLDRTLTITGWLSRRPQGPTYPCVWWKLRLAVNVLMHDLKTTFKKRKKEVISLTLLSCVLYYIPAFRWVQREMRESVCIEHGWMQCWWKLMLIIAFSLCP